MGKYAENGVGPQDEGTFPIEQLSAVSNTALLTLWARAIEARSSNPLLADPAAIAVTDQLRPHLVAHQTPFYQQLLTDQVPPLLTRLMALRARHFDQRAQNFLARFPRALVVNLGAGLDTRFERLNQQQETARVRVIDIDLPPIIALKQTLFAPHARHELLPASVLDFAWMDSLDRYADRRCIFLAEGLLMYLQPGEVQQLVTTLALRFPGAEFVADVFNARLLRQPWKQWAMRKMQRQLQVDRRVAFGFGLAQPKAMEKWDSRIHFLNAWSLLDAPDHKLGMMRMLRHFPFVRWLQYVVHYGLG